ncbi:MAG: TAXI family TRAP transporter solute-binding subunit [Spirochaetales bacterium]|jgi:TRAP transporter TAXI family solute receptor|nr:TAXI family TRAP transporter solute-binding subunit [Exilispira sp.]NMC67791.1 TAXI family TRAP transporter solute-binding subunit [Spirochaetales bacterium]
MKLRYFITLILVVLFATFFVSADKIFLNIGTGGTAGTYYPLGGAIAEILNSKLTNVNATAVSTGGSVANINMLKENSIQMAFVQNDVAYYAYNGIEFFQDKKFTGMKALCSLYPETVQIVTLANKGIKTIYDLKGKRVAVGAAGSGVEVNARQILAAAGLTYKDIAVQYLSFADAANGLRDGTLDVAFLTAGLPTAAVRDIASQKDIMLIKIPDNIVKDLISKYPFYIKTVIPKDTYPKVTEDIQSLAVLAMLVVRDDMTDDLAFSIVKAIFENLQRLEVAHQMGKFIKKENALFGISIPMHPGAEKYFKGK